MKMKDLSGNKYGRWTVIRFDRIFKKSYYWICQCECGTEKSVLVANLTSSKSLSCGCLALELAAQREKTHGKCGTRIYRLWSSMKTRCTNQKEQAYKFYGARGIKVCDKWMNSFEAFYADMGDPPHEHSSIERIDVNGDYCPENCIWIDFAKQAFNKTNSLIVEYCGEKKCVAEWCQILNLPYKLIISRMAHGKSFHEAVTRPKRVIVNHKHLLQRLG
jgi:hypothetical protein